MGALTAVSDALREEIRLKCSDGFTLAATLYSPKSGGDNEGTAARANVIVASAFAVPRRFYRHFAQWLCGRGYRVLCFDYRGVGDSMPEQAESLKHIGMSDWGQLDIEAAIEFCQQWPEADVLVGHSAGGQLPGLASNVWDVSALACVAASAPHVRHYPLMGKLKIGVAWYLMAPIIGRLKDPFPARKLGLFSLDIPSGAMREWARWGRSANYLFSPQFGFDLRRYQALALPMISFSFSDDELASRLAIEALFPHFPKCDLTDHYLTPDECQMKSVGHMGFFFPEAEAVLWPKFEAWLSEHVET